MQNNDQVIKIEYWIINLLKIIVSSHSQSSSSGSVTDNNLTTTLLFSIGVSDGRFSMVTIRGWIDLLDIHLSAFLVCIVRCYIHIKRTCILAIVICNHVAAQVTALFDIVVILILNAAALVLYSCLHWRSSLAQHFVPTAWATARYRTKQWRAVIPHTSIFIIFIRTTTTMPCS